MTDFNTEIFKLALHDENARMRLWVKESRKGWDTFTGVISTWFTDAEIDNIAADKALLRIMEFPNSASMLDAIGAMVSKILHDRLHWIESTAEGNIVWAFHDPGGYELFDAWRKNEAEAFNGTELPEGRETYKPSQTGQAT